MDSSFADLAFRMLQPTKVDPFTHLVKLFPRIARTRTCGRCPPIWNFEFFILYCSTTHRRFVWFSAKNVLMQRVKLNLEFLFRASPAILYKFFTTPDCLIRWFCDEVDIQDDTFTFYWSGYDEVAELVESTENERLKFQWENADDEDEFLEFRISTSPVTGETILEITDFCDEDEVEDQKQLWENQIHQLQKETGG